MYRLTFPALSFTLSILVLSGCPSNDEDPAIAGSGGQQGGAGAGQGGGGASGGGTGGLAGTAGIGGAVGGEGGGGTAGGDAAVDAAGTDGGMVEGDGAVDAGVGDPDGGGDGSTAHVGTGGCCEEHAEPGCEDAEIEACVCEKLPDCCTNTWDLPCVLIVEQKFCEEGVRDCVCGPAPDGWEQTQCCETQWTNFCKETAIIKCGARAGC